MIRNAREKFEFSHDDSDLNEINRLMREYKSSITDAKSNFIRESLHKNKKDSKKLWKTLKSLYSDKHQQIKTIEYDNGDIISCDRENATRLNEAFVSSIDGIVSEIPNASLDHYNEKIHTCEEKFVISKITHEDLLRLLKELKFKSFNDDISGRVLNDAINDVSFSNHLLAIINGSIEQSIMPDELKTSIVTPIPKTSLPRTPNDYRPINNMPVLEKLIESVVHEQLTQYLSRNGILCNEQAGFRKGHSTESSILSVMHDLLQAREDKKKTVAVFLDLKRAFETVSRDVLIDKLKKYGFSESSTKWFKSFLYERKQRVKVNDEISDPIPVQHGLPQGSKLANLLFILFINDIVLNIENSKINMYADDCMIYISLENVEKACEAINEDLSRVCDWLKFNKMSLNARKCSSMGINISNSDKLAKIMINNEEIEKVNCTKYLGVYIDEKLNFECHYEKLTSKINKRLGLLRRLNHKMTAESKEIYLKSIMLPLNDYCSSVLLMLGDVRIKAIQRLINKAMRIVLKQPRDSDVKSMLVKLNLMSVKQRINFNALKLINKTIQTEIPANLSSKFRRRSTIRQRTLRSDSNIDIPPWKNNTANNAIFVHSVKYYNDFASKFSINEDFIGNLKKYINDMI